MSFKQKFAESLIKLGEQLKAETNAVKLAEAMLDSGQTIVSTSEEFIVGGDILVVADGEQIPLEAGTYITTDGVTIVVETAGVIAKIEKAQSTTDSEMPAEMSNEDLKKQLQEVLSKFSIIEKNQKEIEAKFSKQEKSIAEKEEAILKLSSVLTELAEKPAVTAPRDKRMPIDLKAQEEALKALPESMQKLMKHKIKNQK